MRWGTGGAGARGALAVSLELRPASHRQGGRLAAGMLGTSGRLSVGEEPVISLAASLNPL